MSNENGNDDKGHDAPSQDADSHYHGPDDGHGGGPKYHLDLEGVIKEWHSSTITVPEIRQLAGWAADQEVVMVDLESNDEVTLAGDATVQLKPGMGFAKKIKFKRGRR